VRVSRSVRLLAPFVRQQWPALAVAALATLVITAAELAQPFPLKLAIDRLIGGNGGPPFRLDSGDVWLLVLIGALVLVIALADAAASYLSDLLLMRAGERIIHELRMALYAHLQRLALPFHDRRHTGDLVTRITGDVNAVGSLFADSLGTFVSAILILCGMIAVSLAIDPVLTLAGFAVSPLLAFATFRFRRSLRVAARAQRTTEGEIASLSAEALGAMRVVKAFASERFERKRLQRLSEERQSAGFQTSRTESRFAGVVDILGAVGTSVVLVLGVVRVAHGALSVGDLVVITTYVRRVHRPLRDISRQAGRVSVAMARADRIAEILESDEVLAERPHAYVGERARGEVTFEGLSFSYEPDRPALRGLDLRVAPGEKVAIFGRSGAGKSTLAALAMRFYDPEAGRVLLDGRDLRDCSLDWLRPQVGLLQQESILFTGSVAENIAYGGEATREEVIAAAKAAGAHTFISELPQSYETPLGPRGIGLSGGQRQRIAIARTLLRDPAVLILDEPTAELDPVSEQDVLEGLEVLVRGRTTIVITHSLALTMTTDRVVVMEQGQCVQEGRPKELLRAPGPFRNLASEHGLVGRAARRRRVPADDALPRLPTLLDPHEIAPALARSLGPDSPVPDVRIRYLRYKPATNLVVHYDVATPQGWRDAVVMIAAEARLDRRALDVGNRVLARLVDGRSPAPFPLVHDPDLDALIQWLPLDIDLPALAEPPEALRQRLYGEGAILQREQGEPERLGYKPRRRAVLRLDQHILKAYASEAEFERAVVGLRVASVLRGVDSPWLETVVLPLRLTAQRFLVGTPAGEATERAEEAGELLARLHPTELGEPLQAKLPQLGAGDSLRAAAASARLVAAIAPRLAPRVDALVQRLEESLPARRPEVLTHGDFHVGQLLERDAGLTVLDLDELCISVAELDMASYAAHAVRGDDADLERATGLLDGLVDGYGDRPDALPWFLSAAILGRAPFPFRSLDEHWLERVEGMVSAAEQAVAL
jgi:ABC-type multidrug transport system fused ATPase/permease subunit